LCPPVSLEFREQPVFPQYWRRVGAYFDGLGGD
jgi:hypothetical protein